MKTTYYVLRVAVGSTPTYYLKRADDNPRKLVPTPPFGQQQAARFDSADDALLAVGRDALEDRIPWSNLQLVRVDEEEQCVPIRTETVLQ